jgi:diamine N-acetyltransferase
MPCIRIVRATEADASLVARLNSQVHKLHVDHAPAFFAEPRDDEVREALAAMLREADNQAFIAYADEEAIGYILLALRDRIANTFCRANRSLWIEQVLVVPEWRRHGVGRRLVEAATGYARACGIETLVAEVWTFNRDSHAFFQSVGFPAQSVRYCMNTPMQPPHNGA